jgi:hypothetical protein
MFGSTKQSGAVGKGVGNEAAANAPVKPDTLPDKSVYIEGVKVLQRQERISYFFTLTISLVLVLLLFVILRMV